MENITKSLELIYQTLEMLIQFNEEDINSKQYQAINQAIENLEESRRLLYHEKNKLNHIPSKDENH